MKLLRILLYSTTVTILTGLLLAVVAQVIFRYVLHISVPWTEEIARILMIWMVLAGSIIVQKDGSHIRTEFFVSKLPLKIRLILRILLNIASMLFLLSVMKGGFSMIRHTQNIMTGSITWLNTSILYIPIVLCLPFIILFIIRDIVSFRETESDKSTEQRE